MADEDNDKDVFYYSCPEDSAEPAGVHALVIGISRYNELRRRRGRKYPDIAGTASGAAQFARFLTDGFTDPGGIPLRTVRLLLSPIEGQEKYLPSKDLWKEASYDAVGDALEDWANDCNTHHRNVAVLYVAGHGIVTPGGAQWAFLSRAGAVEQPYRYGINLKVIQDRMLFRRARSNIYVIDCCALVGSDVPAWDGDTGIYPGEVQKPPGQSNAGPGRVSQVIIAARVGTSTYSLNAKDGTLLSQALVGRTETDIRESLFCTAGELTSDGPYAVTARRVEDELLPAMRRIRQAHLDGEEPVVLPQKSLIPITSPTPPPKFLVIMMPQPSFGSVLAVTVWDDTGAEVIREELPDDGLRRWLPAGRYRVEATVRDPDGSVSKRPYEFPVGNARRVTAANGWDIK